MKICRICLKSDILCGACNAKLENGEISRTDIDVTRALDKIGKTIKAKDIGFQASVDNGKYIVIITDNMSKLIGAGGMNAKKISSILGKPVRIIPSSEKEMLKTLLGSAMIGMNILYTKDGEMLRIRLKSGFRGKAFVNDAADVAKKVISNGMKNVEFVYE